jgi:DNA-binding MarR family transcriptional regulator
MLHLGERLTKVKEIGQPGLPDRPRGVPDDDLHATANRLHSAALRLLRHASTVDAGMDLDGPRASALSVLVFGGPMPIGRLATLERVSAPAITKLVGALETLGLAERVRSQTDRRVVLVQATARGRSVLERGRAARVRVVAALLDGLPDRDRRVIDRAVTLIADRLAPARPAGATGTGGPRRVGRPTPPTPRTRRSRPPG